MVLYLKTINYNVELKSISVLCGNSYVCAQVDKKKAWVTFSACTVAHSRHHSFPPPPLFFSSSPLCLLPSVYLILAEKWLIILYIVRCMKRLVSCLLTVSRLPAQVKPNALAVFFFFFFSGMRWATEEGFFLSAEVHFLCSLISAGDFKKSGELWPLLTVWSAYDSVEGSEE